MVSDGKRTKKRGVNFTPSEKFMLLELVNKNRSIIENKSVAGVVTRQKQEAWMNIAQEFNTYATSGHRTWSQLRNLYDNIKARNKKLAHNSFDPKMQVHTEDIIRMFKLKETQQEQIVESDLTTEINEPSTCQDTIISTDSKTGEEDISFEEMKRKKIKKILNYKDMYIKEKLNNVRLQKKLMIEQHNLVAKLIQTKIDCLELLMNKQADNV